MTDSAKEINLCDYNMESKVASCYLRETEQFTTWMNADREITELKKGTSRKLIKSGTQKRLWDDCLELEFYIRSNTAHGIYILDGEFPN